MKPCVQNILQFSKHCIPYTNTKMAFTCLTFFLVLLSSEFNQIKGLSITFKDRFLAGHVFAVNYPNDWLQCSLSCQKSPRCVSYNFNFVAGSCELNEHGLREGFKADEQLTEGKDFVFHQIRPIFKNIPPPRRIVENQCDCSCGSETTCTTNPDVNNKFLSVSCKDIWQKYRLSSGAYDLRGVHAHGRHRTYCEMNEIPGCGGGGWTLIMKINGSEQTFTYNSSLWKNKETFLPENGEDLTERETKVPSYWLTPMKKICLGMKYGGKTSWIQISQSGTSLYDVIKDGVYRETHLSASYWTSLLADSYVETGCCREGINVYTRFEGSARARIGIIGFQHNCTAPSTSRLGFGTSGSIYGMDDTNSCGNEEKGVKTMKAFGYVFVQ